MDLEEILERVSTIQSEDKMWVPISILLLMSFMGLTYVAVNAIISLMS